MVYRYTQYRVGILSVVDGRVKAKQSDALERKNSETFFAEL